MGLGWAGLGGGWALKFVLGLLVPFLSTAAAEVHPSIRFFLFLQPRPLLLGQVCGPEAGEAVRMGKDTEPREPRPGPKRAGGGKQGGLSAAPTCHRVWGIREPQLPLVVSGWAQLVQPTCLQGPLGPWARGCILQLRAGLPGGFREGGQSQSQDQRLHAEPLHLVCRGSRAQLRGGPVQVGSRSPPAGRCASLRGLVDCSCQSPPPPTSTPCPSPPSLP